MTNSKDLILGKTYYIDNCKDIAGEFVIRSKDSLFFKVNWKENPESNGGYFARDGIIELSDSPYFYFTEKTE